MNKKKLLYIPDCRRNGEETPVAMDALTKALPDHEIICFELIEKSTEFVLNLLENWDNDERPGIILSEGLSCLFTHTIAGIDRVCVNPCISSALYTDFPAEQFLYDRKPDKDNHTHCWGVFGLNSEEKRNFLMLYYPNVIEVGAAIGNVTDALDVIIPLIRTIGNSGYTDKYGVHYEDYGRTITGTDSVLFQGVEQYEIPIGVVTIEEEAFSVSDIKRIRLPESIQKIGRQAFLNCKQLEEVILPSGLSVISKGCFWGCSSLRHVSLPMSLNYIHQWAFYGTSITEVELPWDIRFVAPNAFNDNVKVSVSMNKMQELLKESNHYQLILAEKELTI